MKTSATIRSIRNSIQVIQNAVIDQDMELAISERANLYKNVLSQIAFGISKSDKELAFEALRAETIQIKYPEV